MTLNPSEHISNNHEDISDPGHIIQIFHPTGHNMKSTPQGYVYFITITGLIVLLVNLSSRKYQSVLRQ